MLSKIKITVAVFIICIMPFALSASPSVCLSLDSMFVQDYFKGYGDIQTNFQAGVNLGDGFSIMVPVTVTFSPYDAETFYDCGIFLQYFPLQKGPYLALSVLQLGLCPSASNEEDRIIGLNETILGYRIGLFKNFYLEPQLVVRDPSQTFSEEYSHLRGIYSGYETFRIRLLFSFRCIDFKEAKK